MKKTIFFTVVIMLFTTAAWSQTTYEKQQIREHAEAILDILDGQQELLISNVTAEWTREKLMQIQWESSRDDVPIDIQFYDPEVHRPWQLSVLKYNDGTMLSGKDQHPIGLGSSDTDRHTWMIRIVSIDGEFASQPFELKPRTQESEQSELFEVQTSEQEGSEFFRTDFYGGSILGFFELDGDYHIYFQNRAETQDDGTYVVERMVSDDLETWEDRRRVNMSGNTRLLKVNGEIQCWVPDGGDAYIWTDFRLDNGCLDRSHQAINDWKIDGTLGPNFIDGKYMQLGRVRGWQSHENGGWEDDLADYPDPAWYPDLIEAYQEQAPGFDPRRNLHDRRGISLHIGEAKNVWSNEIIVDPENVELPGFLGWEYADKKGIADFYSATFVDAERILVKVYWKENDRLIDRSKRGDEFTPMRPQRRFRFTGETTVIAARLNGNEIQWGSFDSVFPYDRFARKAHPDVTWATCPDCIEVGQYTQSSNVIHKDGFVYVGFQYRDDVHYESANNRYGEGKIRHLTGIYVYKVPEEEFNQWFE